ncbi:uncharacterized protein [Parasteatoda tepidariorum]|uniref:uncharacterized protein n=1 Tax=Parasteatoda tepidariorum TaxID=114398 RepID=UPI0039BD9016
MAVFRVENTNVTALPVNNSDKITLYQIGWDISSNEAVWRIFGFLIHERDPTVIYLAVHLENGQRAYFTNETAIDRAVNPPKTTLTEFFDMCYRVDAFCVFARTLLYSEVPHYFTWSQTKKWTPRKQGTPVDACPDVCKVDEHQHTTYKDECLTLGFLEDDSQGECMLAEAALNCTAKQIRLLFAIVLTTCFPARIETLWDNYKDSMTDDILYQHRTRCNDLTIAFSDAMYNEALIDIEDLCIITANLPLSRFGMLSPNRSASDLLNNDMNREFQYNTVEIAAIVTRNVPLMNEEQRNIYDSIMLAFRQDKVDFF